MDGLIKSALKAFPERLSTGVKMLLILSMALLPLGLIAVFASREAAQVNRLRQDNVARAMATASAAAITEQMRPLLYGLRQAIDDVTPETPDMPMDRRQCMLRLQGLMIEQRATTRYAIYDPYGRRLCATAAYSGLPAYPGQDRIGYNVALTADGSLLRASILDSSGGHYGVAEFSATTISRFARPDPGMQVGLVLRQGSQEMPLAHVRPANALDAMIRVSTPVAGGQLGLELAMPVTRLSAAEILLILLPILMWASGALIGWLVVDRLLLRPLGQMQRAVAAFRASEGPLELPRLHTPAHEIDDLGIAFMQATDALRQHEAELDEGLARQKKLTREVHHRVKNNLQVVSSLISLHARGTTSPEAGEAYAAIQRRVDAIALVHRHHYAEAEDNPGVSLPLLIGEIATNLRASIATDSGLATILLEIAPVAVTQDVAVPVAFLLTEIVERALATPAPGAIHIRVDADTAPDMARLSICTAALTQAYLEHDPGQQRFRRIVAGFARQLRSPLEHDPETGCFAILIRLLDRDVRTGEA